MAWLIRLCPWHICRSHPVYDGSIVPSPGGGNRIDHCGTAESHKRASILPYRECVEIKLQVIVRVAEVKASRNLTARLVRDQSKETPRKLRVALYSGCEWSAFMDPLVKINSIKRVYFAEDGDFECVACAHGWSG
jgi:hypothetical protein